MPDGMRMMVPADLDALDQSELFSAEAKQAYRDEIGRAQELRERLHHRRTRALRSLLKGTLGKRC
jgi:hypothetical protein